MNGQTNTCLPRADGGEAERVAKKVIALEDVVMQAEAQLAELRAQQEGECASRFVDARAMIIMVVPFVSPG